MKYRKTGDHKWPYEVLKYYSHALLPCMSDLPGEECEFRGRDGQVYFTLDNGCITIRKGYRWDGLDWSPDFRCAMEASLVHDALYQWIEARKTRERFRECADQHFYCLAKNTCGPRLASMMYRAIRGYQTGWLVGGFLGGIWGLFSRPGVSCDFGP